MSAGMTAAHARKATRPDHCQKCGAPGTVGNPLEWYGRADEKGERHRRWLCELCMLGPMVPLELEDFARTGESNLGGAQSRG